MPVQELVEGLASRKAAIEELEELAANVGFHRLAERWVEPNYAAAPPRSSARFARHVFDVV